MAHEVRDDALAMLCRELIQQAEAIGFRDRHGHRLELLSAFARLKEMVMPESKDTKAR